MGQAAEATLYFSTHMRWLPCRVGWGLGDAEQGLVPSDSAAVRLRVCEGGRAPVADLDEEVAGRVQRHAARPEPAGLLHAHAQPQRPARVRPVQRARAARGQLPLLRCQIWSACLRSVTVCGMEKSQR